jgi:hypothetical protein
MPDILNPPKGAPGSRTSQQLIYTVPARIFAAK